MKGNTLAAAAMSAAVLFCAFPAFCGEPAPDDGAIVAEVNNAWRVFEARDIDSPLFVTLKQVDAHWEITGIHESPPQIPRNDATELLTASRDLQQWGAYGPRSMTSCDSFEAREYPYKTVCTSVFSERKTGRAALGIFLYKLGTKGVPLGYDSDKVTAAVRSIRPAQAQALLTAFEKQ